MIAIAVIEDMIAIVIAMIAVATDIASTTAIATTKAFASASCCLLTQADTVLLLPLSPP